MDNLNTGTAEVAETTGLSADEQAAFDAQRAGSPEPEASEAPAKAEETPKPEPKQVPLGALQEERERRKAIEAELRQMREMQARLDERLKSVQQPQQQQPVGPPDPMEDFTGWARHGEQALTQTRQEVEALKAQMQQEAQFRTVAEDYRANLHSFAQQTPDFADAYNHFVNTRAAELRTLGYSEAQIAAQIPREEVQLHTAIRQRGGNVGEVVYNLAKTRGYAPKPPAPSPAEKIQQVAQSQAVNKSLAAAESTGKGEITSRDVANMSMDEFAEWGRKNPQKLAKLMGK
jgi:hypothetical protein